MFCFNDSIKSVATSTTSIIFGGSKEGVGVGAGVGAGAGAGAGVSIIVMFAFLYVVESMVFKKSNGFVKLLTSIVAMLYY